MLSGQKHEVACCWYDRLASVSAGVFPRDPRDFHRRVISVQHGLEANTGAVRANRNADDCFAASCGDRRSDDGSALVAATVTGACRSAIYSPTGAKAACRRKRLGGDLASGEVHLAVPQPVSTLYVDVA